MKKFIAFFIVGVLYLTPLAAFSQRNKYAAQTKLGILSIEVEYKARQTREIDKTESGKTKKGSFAATFEAKFNAHVQNKAVSHDGFVSLIEPSDPQADGVFSYAHTGKEVMTDEDGSSTYSVNENYAGKISEGNAQADTPDQGDGISGVQSNASGAGRANCETTLSSRDGKTTTEDYCSPVPLGSAELSIGDAEQSTEKPGETSYAVELNYKVNVRKKVSGDTESWAVGENWLPLTSDGGFAAGGYQFSFSQTRSPKDSQSDRDGEKITFTETVTVKGSFALGAGGKKQAVNFAAQNSFAFEQALALLPKKEEPFSETEYKIGRAHV